MLVSNVYQIHFVLVGLLYILLFLKLQIGFTCINLSIQYCYARAVLMSTGALECMILYTGLVDRVSRIPINIDARLPIDALFVSSPHSSKCTGMYILCPVLDARTITP